MPFRNATLVSVAPFSTSASLYDSRYQTGCDSGLLSPGADDNSWKCQDQNGSYGANPTTPEDEVVGIFVPDSNAGKRAPMPRMTRSTSAALAKNNLPTPNYSTPRARDRRQSKSLQKSKHLRSDTAVSDLSNESDDSKLVKLQAQRRLSHSAIERRYRLRLNQSITDLARRLRPTANGSPDADDNSDNENAYLRRNGKIETLVNAASYIDALQSRVAYLESQVDGLERESTALKGMCHSLKLVMLHDGSILSL